MFNNKFSMKRLILFFHLSLLTFNFFGQTVTQKLQKAFTAFEKDSQLKHAISSLYVIDANTGQVVFDKNSQIGLAPASTQKIITSVTAFELLGKDYRYKTEIRSGDDKTTFVVGSGDPSLGSWRFDKDGHNFFAAITNAFRGKNKTLGKLITIDRSDRLLPDGWIYQDIGNYYGANAYGLNWRENQFDMTFIPGKLGEPAQIDTVATELRFWNGTSNDVKTGPLGSGDNAYIYFVGYDFTIKGTVPAGVKRFTISGADPYPQYALTKAFYTYCDSNNIAIERPDHIPYINYYPNILTQKAQLIYTHYSPSLDSLIYWFNKKSINLYGEALLKTFAYEKNGFGSTDSGVVIVKKFWKEKGMDEDELSIVDGSGLSPLNRVTTHAQVEILKYAKTKDWFPYFYNSLPEFNGMKIKSGTIRGVKGFCGYHIAKNGKEYIFSFLVNNYNGSSSALVSKMYKVLDILK
jgi:D-alanyl-D-alanine carboxypeptidase/D-alanyl-D-alanine-endopeptidase (penicillin-binding protein 4)